MTRIDQASTPQVHTHGSVAPEATAYAVQKLEAALHHAPAPVLRSWLTLDTAAPGDRVEAHVDVSGVGVHVHAVGDTLQEATDAMQERLRSRLRRIRRRPAQGPRPPAVTSAPLEPDGHTACAAPEDLPAGVQR
jgi:ribosome-associated translation inhibitor RaiA